MEPSALDRRVPPELRAEIILEIIHAAVVVIVVFATTILAYFAIGTIPSDTVGVVYGAAIGYASGRAGPPRTAQRVRRATDTDTE